MFPLCKYELFAKLLELIVLYCSFSILLPEELQALRNIHDFRVLNCFNSLENIFIQKTWGNIFIDLVYHKNFDLICYALYPFSKYQEFCLVRHDWSFIAKVFIISTSHDFQSSLSQLGISSYCAEQCQFLVFTSGCAVENKINLNSEN